MCEEDSPFEQKEGRAIGSLSLKLMDQDLSRPLCLEIALKEKARKRNQSRALLIY